MKFIKGLSIFILGNRLISSDAACLGLYESCNHDCDCCGHPNNQAIRCETRNKDLGKLCYEGRSSSGPCASNVQCLSQNCVDGVCLPPLNRPTTPVDVCPLGTANDVVTAVSGELPKCACDKTATESLSYAMDGDLSTDYTNFHSKGYSGLIFEPSLKAPVRAMQVCTSNQDAGNDPLCYRIEGWCEDNSSYTLVQHGLLPLSTARQECKTIKIGGRQDYGRYRVQFGCRRGGYILTCPSNPTEPTSPSNPTEPTSPSNPTEPTSPSNPAEPTSPSNPTEPTSPSNPTEPTSPSEPTNLSNPTEPTNQGPSCDPSKASCKEVAPKGKDETCTPLHDGDGTNAFSEFMPYSIDYDDVKDVTVHTYSFLNKIGKTGKFPDLSHAVLQYVGACCVSQVRVYAIQNGKENVYYTSDSPGDHLQSPKPTVCMSGIDLPGVEGAQTYYYEITVNGYFPTTTTVDYVLKGGLLVKYSKVQGPDCRCVFRRSLSAKRLFRGLPLDLESGKRRAQVCVDKPVSISEVKLFGKCNQG